MLFRKVLPLQFSYYKHVMLHIAKSCTVLGTTRVHECDRLISEAKARTRHITSNYPLRPLLFNIVLCPSIIAFPRPTLVANESRHIVNFHGPLVAAEVHDGSPGDRKSKTSRYIQVAVE